MGDDGEVSDPSRVGAPTNLDHFSAGWNLGCNMQVTKPTKMSVMNFFLSINHRDRSLYLAYQEMENVNRLHLGLPDNIMYSAKMKYKKFVEAVLCRGAVRAGIKANCIFQACKEAGVNRTSKEISDAFGIQERDISRTTDMYKEQNPDTEQVNMTMPKDLVARFFNNIEVPDKGRVKMKCIQTCLRLEESIKLQGRTPKAVACAVIYVVLGGTLSKKQVCEACDVSPPTLSKLEPIVRAELSK
jgi:transcription initiation factor TFIIIB Brf1 subunit/transcription initiation factor TFIIB